MKTVFKPLGIAAAVAAATAGYTGAVSAQEVSSRNLGDLGLIPFYTVQGGFATAIHIINTTNKTQVVKLRARRGFDSADALDFNIIMSPEDVWVGSMTKKADDTIVITTDDTTCTAPAGDPTGNEGVVEFVMPDNNSDSLINYRTMAEEGYIEIIGMAEIGVDSPIGIASKHVDGVPRDCAAVRSNFFRVAGAAVPGYTPGDTPTKGVHSPAVTAQTCTGTAGTCGDVLPGLALNVFDETQSDALKVSWAVTDGNAGLEVGGNAVHIEGFSTAPMMTNQQTLVIGEEDALGSLFPDLDGGSPLFGTRGQYDAVVRPLLGASGLASHWSSRDVDGGFTVSTDWVVTMPGQYLMVDPLGYLAALELDNPLLCLPGSCDRRDIPASVAITYRDREEEGFTPEEGGLVVSPAVSPTDPGALLRYETNTIEWNVGGAPVFNSQYQLEFSPLFDGDRGWSNLTVTPALNKAPQGVYNYAATAQAQAADPNAPAVFDNVANTDIPIIGFAAWERNFASSPDANYGRAVDHSYGSSN